MQVPSQHVSQAGVLAGVLSKDSGDLSSLLMGRVPGSTDSVGGTHKPVEMSKVVLETDLWR